MDTQPARSLASDKADLCWRIKSTSGSRFNAAKRMKSQDWLITLLNNFSSVAVIFFSIVPLSLSIDDRLNKLLTLALIFVSLIILVTSLMQSGSDNRVNAEKMHDCARELNALRYDILYREIKSEDELRQCVGPYMEILGRYPNHSDGDYDRYRREHPDEFKGYPSRGRGVGIWPFLREFSSSFAVTTLIGLILVLVGTFLASIVKHAGRL